MKGRFVFTVCLFLMSAIVAVIFAAESQGADDNLLRQLIERVQRLEARDRDQQAEIDDLRARLSSNQKRTLVLERIIRQLKSNGRSKVKEGVIQLQTGNEVEKETKDDVTMATDDTSIVPGDNKIRADKRNGNYVDAILLLPLNLAIHQFSE